MSTRLSQHGKEVEEGFAVTVIDINMPAQGLLSTRVPENDGG